MNRRTAVTIGLILSAVVLGGCAAAPAADVQIEDAAEAEVVVMEEAAEEPEVVEEGDSTDAQEADTSETVVLVDGFGREVELTLPVTQIVSIAPSNVEILFAIGAGDQVVGRDDTTDFPEEALAITSIGSTWGELNSEAILALEPDVVLGADLTSPEQIAQLESLGIPVFVLGNPVDFEGLFDNIRLAGVLTGREAEAEDLVTSLAERVTAVRNSVQDADSLRVFYEVDGTDPAAPWTVGAGTFHDYVITMAGGENIAADLDYYATLSTEDIVTADPEVIVFGAGPWVPTTVESLGERPGWDAISAVVNGRVYGIDTNWIDRPGPRLVDAYESLAEYLHPEKFE